ncbi:hypothetical protein EWM64_g918, partial [Hericium alpestre]
QGGLGFLMSIASTLSIKITSPITHMISSAIRGVAASLLGMWLFGDILSSYVPAPSTKPRMLMQVLAHSGRVWAIAVILLGSLYYTWVKHVESSAPHPAAKTYERIPLEEAEEGVGADGKHRN